MSFSDGLTEITWKVSAHTGGDMNEPTMDWLEDEGKKLLSDLRPLCGELQIPTPDPNINNAKLVMAKILDHIGIKVTGLPMIFMYTKLLVAEVLRVHTDAFWEFAQEKFGADFFDPSSSMSVAKTSAAAILFIADILNYETDHEDEALLISDFLDVF